MPYKNMWESKGLLTKHYGVVSLDEILFSINEMCGDERFDDINYRLVDLLDVEKVASTIEDIDAIIALDMVSSIFNKKIKLAIVSSDEGMQALAAYFISQADELPWDIHSFSAVEEAREWVCGGQTN